MTSDSKEQVVLVNGSGADLIDSDGRIVTLPKMAAHIQGRRHRAVSVFIFSSRGELMLQQRAAGKYHSPGLWSNTCCTHPRPYEIPIDAARRRLNEEMGICCPLVEIFRFAYAADVGNGLIENEYDHVFFGFTDTHPVINPNEVASWRWSPLGGLVSEMAASPDRYAPWFRSCFSTVMDAYRKCGAKGLLSPKGQHDPDPVLGYLQVDAFIKTMLDASALWTAFDIGMIDYLVSRQLATSRALEEQLKISPTAMTLLLGLLISNNVIESSNTGIKLTPSFIRILKYRDLLEVQLVACLMAARDLMNHFKAFIGNPEEFKQKSRFFRWFDYSRCFEENSENRRITERWMRITTTLTKYESRVCMKYHDFSRYRHMMDIGGNSGEFVLRICRKHPHLSATVVDLPLVCDIGRKHIAAHPESNRIRFVEKDALRDDLPKNVDLVTFKSMLHDWPEDAARHLIKRGAISVKPGGVLLIFERGPIETGETPLPYSSMPFLIFSHFYRSSRIYETILESLGCQDITTQQIDLGWPFFLISARKI